MHLFMYGAAAITIAAGMIGAAQLDPSIAMTFALGLLIALAGLLAHFGEQSRR